MSRLAVALTFALAEVFLIGNCKLFTNVYPKLRQYDGCQGVKNYTDPLILTPLIEDGRIDEARNRSLVRHKELAGIESHSGYFTVNKKTNSNLFFWFFRHQGNEPVLLWLQGGPGISSLFGLFTENGPFKVKTDCVEQRKYAWTGTHSVLYIDNPVGTGYSFTTNGFAKDVTDVGRDLYEALTQFFKLFPELQKNEFYATGENYAGKYVPALAYTILKNNPKAETKINLQGLAIGNGFSDPVNQLNYGDYLYQIGLLDSRERETIAQVERIAVNYIKARRWKEASDVLGAFLDGDETNPSLFSNYTGFQNHYNFLNSDKYDISGEYLAKFVQRCDIRNAIHVGNTRYNVENSDVEKHLQEDIPQSVAPWISELLSHYRLLVYNGQLDIISAYPLSENYLMKLNFSSSDEFRTGKKKFWYVQNDLAGYVKEAGNLTFVLVRNAGHMVPTDQPQAAFELIDKFTHHKPLAH